MGQEEKAAAAGSGRSQGSAPAWEGKQGGAAESACTVSALPRLPCLPGPSTRRLKQEGHYHQFNASLGYVVRPRLKK